MSNAPDDLQIALEHHQAGRLPQADRSIASCCTPIRCTPMPGAFWVRSARGRGSSTRQSTIESSIGSQLQIGAESLGRAAGSAESAGTEAADLLAQTLRDQPADADACNNLGLVRAHQGRNNEAVAAYQRAVQLRPDFPAARGNLDLLLQHQQGESPPPSPTQTAEANTSSVALLHVQQGLALAPAGSVPRSQNRVRTSLMLDPRMVDARNDLGCIHFLQGRNGEAIACYEAVLRRTEHVDALSNLGAALLKQGDAEQAILHCREALRLKPDLAAAYTHLANALRETGQQAEAERYYEQALRLKPDDPSAQADQGAVLLRHGKLAEAAACFREACV